jgi:hypothetical protein
MNDQQKIVIIADTLELFLEGLYQKPTHQLTISNNIIELLGFTSNTLLADKLFDFSSQNDYNDSLFEDQETIKILKVDSLKAFEEQQDKLPEITWITNLNTKEQNDLKKNKNIELIVSNKNKKILLKVIESKLNYKFKNQDFSSYYELVEEYYFYSLTGKAVELIESKPLLFFFGLKNLDKFYKYNNEQESQLILSLLFTKALKVNDQKALKMVQALDYGTKTSYHNLSLNNLFGYNFYCYLK